MEWSNSWIVSRAGSQRKSHDRNKRRKAQVYALYEIGKELCRSGRTPACPSRRLAILEIFARPDLRGCGEVRHFHGRFGPSGMGDQVVPRAFRRLAQSRKKPCEKEK